MPEAVERSPEKEPPRRGLLRGRDIPDDMWIRCLKCKELLYTKEFERNKKVCQKCGYHFRLTTAERLDLLLDPDSWQELNPNVQSVDPLGFTVTDSETYPAKIREHQKKTGLRDALTTGIGTIEGHKTIICIADFNFMGASMGGAFGEKLARAVEYAIEHKLAVLTVSASGGARMQENLFSLMQMAKTTAALSALGAAGLPHFSLLTDPCYGGVTASYASIADVILAEPGAIIGFAGPRVIEQVTRQKLPAGFQTAEFQLEHGMIDRVTPRKELRSILNTLICLYSPAHTHGTQTSDHTTVGGNEIEQSYTTDALLAFYELPAPVMPKPGTYVTGAADGSTDEMPQIATPEEKR